MVRVLFVCLGNICRSPMAEGVFQHFVNKAGLGEQILVDSAGTGGWHVGERAHGGTRQQLKQHGIPYNGRSRQVRRGDFADFDYILAMDLDNLANLQSMDGGKSAATIKLFLDYAPQTGVREVPDPYYDGGFDRVYDLVEQAAQGLLAAIREEHTL